MNKLDDLIVLQYEQLRHDERAHSDILCLPTKARITHMTLHFAKYVGALFNDPDDETYRRVLIDAAIIALASANCLNVDLSTQIRDTKRVRSYRELADAMKCDVSTIRQTTLKKLALATGTMAKACESLDHQEKGDWRGVLEQGVVQIASLVFASLQVLGFDWAGLIRSRWRMVERKSIFYPAQAQPSDAGNHVMLVKNVG